MSKLRRKWHSCEEAADKVIWEGAIVRFLAMLREITEPVFFFPPHFLTPSHMWLKMLSLVTGSARAQPRCTSYSLCDWKPKNSHLGLVAANTYGGGETWIESALTHFDEKKRWGAQSMLKSIFRHLMKLLSAALTAGAALTGDYDTL